MATAREASQIVIPPPIRVERVALNNDDAITVIDLRPLNDSSGEIIEIRPESQLAKTSPQTTRHRGSRKPKKPCLRISKISLIPALLAAGVEVTDVMTSLIGAEQSYAIIIPASMIAFLTSFGLTGSPTEETFEEIIDIIKKRRFPDENEEWPVLTVKQESAAITMGLIFTTWGLFSKFTIAYFLLNTIPSDYEFEGGIGWKLSSVAFACGYSISGLLTESWDAYKYIRKRIAGKGVEFSSRLALGLGAPFAIVNASMDSTQSAASISATYNIKRPRFFVIALTALLLDGGQKLAFEGATLIKGMYDFMAHLQNVAHRRARIKPAAAAAFSISLALTIFLEYCEQPLNNQFYNDEAKDLNINFTYMVNCLLTLSWLAFVGGVLLGVPSLFPEIKSSVKWVGRKIDECSSHEPEVEEASDEEDSTTDRSVSAINPEQTPLLKDYDEREVVLDIDPDKKAEPEETFLDEKTQKSLLFYRDNQFTTFNNFKRMRERAEKNDRCRCTIL